MTEDAMPPPPPPGRTKAGTVVALTMIFAGIAAAIVINSRRHTIADGAKKIIEAHSRKAEDLPVIGEGVPDFTLQERSGKLVSRQDLLGRVWVGELFFTYCGAVCPRMNRNLSDIHREFVGKDEPKFVSFSVDPARDTLDTVRDYAKMHHADPDRWWFLIGDDKVVQKIANSMALAFDAGKPATHSNRFVLVDRDGQVRGAYIGDTAEPPDELRRDLRALLDAPRKE